MPSTEKRGDGPRPWRVRFINNDGERDSASGFETEDEAYDYGLDQETDIRRGVYHNPRRGEIPFRDYAKEWIDAHDVASTSEVSYRSRLNAVILPRWGGVAIGTITTLEVRSWVKSLRRKGYSTNYIANVVMQLRMMLDDAVVDKYITYNPVEKKSRRGKVKPKEKAKTIFATPNQVAELAQRGQVLRGEMGEMIILTLAYTGMRLGELYGLLRTDCNLLGKEYERSLTVARQFQYQGGERALPIPKYDSGRRIVLPPFLADRLSALLATHKSRFVFTAPEGGQLLTGGSFYDSFWHPATRGRPARPASRGHRALPALPGVTGLEGMVPHGLRHGHAVWLDEAGHPDVAIEERLGHETRTVKGTYRHATPSMERAIAEALQGWYEGATSAREASRSVG
ncbi:tyrosine-type recombinase/integrase [Embleya sp. NPDC020630]|uniref:tyrosine-type recombinase/integrase n=1 Tax=Embleya sp. NPDC020630 TaxID=3363979 RepID=UPI0037890CF7